MTRVTPDLVFEELNLVRADPAAYSEKLERLLPHFRGLILTQNKKYDLQTTEGPAAVQDAIDELKRTSALTPFVLSEGLSRAAQCHCDECGPVGHTGHEGVSGSNMELRIKERGVWVGGIGESLSYGWNTAEKVVVQMLVDDGVETRGDRWNILNPDFNVVGIGSARHSELRYMTTVCFAAAFRETGGHWVGKVSASRAQPIKGSKVTVRNPEEEQWPEGAVEMRRSVERIQKGRTLTTNIKKRFTLQDGTKQTQVESFEEEI